jgi:hypothetical protein
LDGRGPVAPLEKAIIEAIGPVASVYNARPRPSAFARSTGTKPLIISRVVIRAVDVLALIAPAMAPRESTTGTAIDRSPISSS